MNKTMLMAVIKQVNDLEGLVKFMEKTNGNKATTRRYKNLLELKRKELEEMNLRYKQA